MHGDRCPEEGIRLARGRLALSEEARRVVEGRNGSVGAC